MPKESIGESDWNKIAKVNNTEKLDRKRKSIKNLDKKVKNSNSPSDSQSRGSFIKKGKKDIPVVLDFTQA